MKTAQIIKGIIILLFAIVAFTACEDVVEVELNDEDIDLIAVEAYINTKAENNVYVKLERTLAVNQTAQNPVISNAVVQLSDNADSPNTVTLEEQGTTGIYMLPAGTNYPGVAGRTYTLTITTPKRDILALISSLNG